ncbi:aspartate 1-decarboxylase [Calditerrivibrio nitroreducens]|uniref:Aspartate 1-decarboxylase n=1 Tax=Calditerrivibrio nitroreducens (strain DSM 19672 / NBRC 101217 / Yu37-1) TaxID=768670 RepID=E4TIH9_CALNY|nr:aspartate 1-decarboxylase [Calditerrivibrio nitroreducens]ADR19027.1 L-aspartate 1-decarboxylase [Calditerrivibrio nitroreducens DSM 19672]
MLRTMFKAKIHRATVTDADLNYEGSITIDEDLLDASGILPYEKVDIYNITNGARFSTYTIVGKRGSGEICLNGAAARLVQKGDLVIIVSYGIYSDEDLKNYKPVVVHVDKNNKIIKV